MSRRAALAVVAVLVVAAGVGAMLLTGDDPTEEGLATERERRASAIPVNPDEPVLWGNFVVRAKGDEPVELSGIELLGASEGIRVRRALVAGGRRPQERLLAAGLEDFRDSPGHDRWVRSFRPLRGYEVERVDGPWDPSFPPGRRTRAGLWADTEVVLELEPVGRGRFQVTGGLRLSYSVDGEEGRIDLPNQLALCAPKPCRPPRPRGF